MRGFVRGTSGYPDPLLVITSDGVVEYVHSKKPIAVVDFDSLSRISLQVSGRSFSDSTIVHLVDVLARLALSRRQEVQVAVGLVLWPV